jgi:hypothetical protein
LPGLFLHAYAVFMLSQAATSEKGLACMKLSEGKEEEPVIETPDNENDSSLVESESLIKENAALRASRDAYFID